MTNLRPSSFSSRKVSSFRDSAGDVYLMYLSPAMPVREQFTGLREFTSSLSPVPAGLAVLTTEGRVQVLSAQVLGCVLAPNTEFFARILTFKMNF